MDRNNNNFTKIYNETYYHSNKNDRNISEQNVIYIWQDKFTGIPIFENIKFPIIIDNDKICFDKMFSKLEKLLALS